MVLSVAVHGQLALLLWSVVVSRWEGAQTGAKVPTPGEVPKDKEQGAKIPKFPSGMCSNIERTSH